MRKKLSVAAVAAGIVLILIALVLPVFLSGKTDVVGGADWPTAVFLFRQKTAGLAWAGALLAIGGAISLLIRKK